MVNVEQQFSSIAVNEILFSKAKSPRTATVSGMLFMSGADICYNHGGVIYTVNKT